MTQETTPRTKRTRTSTWWIAALVVITAGGTFMSYRWMDQQFKDASFAAKELDECQVLASQIAKARIGPKRAEESEIDHSQLNRTIERVVVAGGIDSGRLRRIEPAYARRLGDSPYLTKPTEVHLDRVTLSQSVTFLRNLVEEQDGLRIDELRLQAPHGEEVGQAWILDATVSYLIYDPVTKE